MELRSVPFLFTFSRISILLNMMNDWKDRLGVVFSTNQDYNYEYDEPQEQETLPPGQQKLRVTIEKKGRGGKVATIVKGFVGTDADRGKLEKMLKT